MTGLKWTAKAVRKIAKELATTGIQANKDTVGNLMRDMGYSLRVNYKKLSKDTNITPQDRKIRNEQFRYIKMMRRRFAQAGDPTISVDTKKKEQIGQFKNPGTSWEKERRLVYDHDFASYAIGIGIPFGIYEPEANRGMVFVGTTHDTSEFAVECIQKWWCLTGRKRYSLSHQLLILADSGGSNGYRRYLWKYYLFEKLCKPYNLSVTVCHYPPYASKWNPIERRLFSEISKNWRGQPLTSYEKMLNFIRRTKTTTGLKVNAYLVERDYQTGQTITEEQWAKLPIVKHDIFPEWNYTLVPQWKQRM